VNSLAGTGMMMVSTLFFFYVYQAKHTLQNTQCKYELILTVSPQALIVCSKQKA
jgi:hypothetical protein